MHSKQKSPQVHSRAIYKCARASVHTYLPTLQLLFHLLSAPGSTLLWQKPAPLLVRQGKGQEELGSSLERLMVRIDRRSDNVLNQNQARTGLHQPSFTLFENHTRIHRDLDFLSCCLQIRYMCFSILLTEYLGPLCYQTKRQILL